MDKAEVLTKLKDCRDALNKLNEQWVSGILFYLDQVIDTLEDDLATQVET